MYPNIARSLGQLRPIGLIFSLLILSVPLRLGAQAEGPNNSPPPGTARASSAVAPTPSDPNGAASPTPANEGPAEQSTAEAAAEATPGVESVPAGSAPVSSDALEGGAPPPIPQPLPAFETRDASGEVDGEQPPKQPDVPVRSSIGIYILEVQGISLADHSFKADFWLWSKGTAGEEILTDLQFLNAERVTVHSETVEEVGDISWVRRRVSGVFRQDYDLADYPFDRQTLTIDMLYTGSTRLADLQADVANSDVVRGAPPDGWLIKDFSTEALLVEMASNLGDPTRASGHSEHPGLRVEVDVERVGLSEFWKLISSLLIGVLLMVVSFFLDVDSPASRYAMLGGAMFAVVLSLRSAAVALGVDGTSVETLHYFALGLMLAAVAVTLVGSILSRNGVPLGTLRLVNYGLAFLFLLIFVGGAWPIVVKS